MKLSVAMSREIDSFNALQEKAGRPMRLKYDYSIKCAGEQGALVMGSEDQLKAGSHQAQLVDDPEAAYFIARAFRLLHCAEFGE